ncbi:MAG: Apolipoprotein N-acyltransferase [Candidatus Omnitrophica bacterium ADurb.Bin277]|nr:MAG: Apolipoprotein N-acyltransferase [Candidatus Omnitrophica bacterium ADurb.Bin277]
MNRKADDRGRRASGRILRYLPPPILHPVVFSSLCGVLLALSYPRPGLGFLAWFALVPLFYAIRSARSGFHAFGLGYLAGFVFYSISMHWMTHVTSLGWLLLSVMESFYIAVFAWLVYLGKRTRWSAVFKILWAASAWTLTEFMRSEIPVFGFGWNLIAYSQASCPAMIQAASVIGTYGLGFLIVCANVCLAKLFLKEKKRPRGAAAALFTSVLLIICGVFVYGEWRLKGEEKPEEFLRVSVLQGNIPQSLKWAPVAREKILEIYSKLTELASLDMADLVIWPEASFPGYFNRDFQSETVKRLPVLFGTPLLIGGLHWEAEKEVYNSAYFLDKSGEITQRYDKLHLVPFGEYIPLKPFFFWLTPIADALGISDFSPGKDAVIFRWAREEWPFGVLICFEDVLPGLARGLASRGAKFLAVITNDAWFMDTAAPFQHLQASIFRAVETGLPVVRAANTGVSGFVSSRGEVLSTVKNEKEKETFIAGRATYDLPLTTRKTIYSGGGWRFPYFSIVLFTFLAVLMMRRGMHEKI